MYPLPLRVYGCNLLSCVRVHFARACASACLSRTPLRKRLYTCLQKPSVQLGGVHSRSRGRVSDSRTSLVVPFLPVSVHKPYRFEDSRMIYAASPRFIDAIH